MQKGIWSFPDFSQGLLFSKESVFFLLDIALVLAVLGFFLRRRRAPGALLTAAAVFLFGRAGMLLAQNGTEEPVLQMVITVTAAFFGAWLTRHAAEPFLSRLSARQPRTAHSYDELARGEPVRRGRSADAFLLASVYFTVLYLIWRFFFTIPYRFGVLPSLASAMLLVLELLGAVDTFAHYHTMRQMKRYPLPRIPNSQFPPVDIFVSTYTEPVELLRKTLLACKQMDYPNKSKVHIYLCDDGRRPEMGELARELEVNYLVRDTHEGAKAGNLNFALAHSVSPYIVTLDADMIPQSGFLLGTIPYFVDAERKNRSRPEKERVELGFVQTPQSFYDADLFQFNLYSEDRIPNEQDYFYRCIQVARTGSNSVIYGGSNTVLSRKALEDVGGFYTGSITEDFATGLLLEKKGYVSLATDLPLASGMNPHSLQSLIGQRSRWARGVIATARKLRILTAPELSFVQKLNYWSSVWYWYAPVKRLIYSLLPIAYALFGVTMFQSRLPLGLVFWLPMWALHRLCQHILGHGIREARWSGVYEMAMFPFLLGPVLLETLGVSLRQFKITNKTHPAGRTSRPGYVLPFLLLIVLSLAGIVQCLRAIAASGYPGPVLLLIWLFGNLYLFIMALFFTGGRAHYPSGGGSKPAEKLARDGGAFTDLWRNISRRVAGRSG